MRRPRDRRRSAGSVYTPGTGGTVANGNYTGTPAAGNAAETGLLRVMRKRKCCGWIRARWFDDHCDPEPRSPDLPRRIQVCRLGITRQADGNFKQYIYFHSNSGTSTPAVIRPADLDTPNSSLQVPEAPVLALHQLQCWAAMQQAAITIIIQTPAVMTGPGSANSIL